MKLQRITFTIEQLRSIPIDERALIVVLTHALNEINALNKLLFFCSKIDPEPQWKAHAHVAQACILARTLIGKLSETWVMVQKGYLKSKLDNVYSAYLEPSTTAALSYLKKYFGPKNHINSVRNKFAFHYSLDHARTSIPEDTTLLDLSIYLHENNENTLYFFAEYLMNKALVDEISPDNPEAALNKLLLEMSAVIASLNEFIQGLLFVILEKHIGEDILYRSLHQIDLGEVPRSLDIEIPFFIEVVSTADVATPTLSID